MKNQFGVLCTFVISLFMVILTTSTVKSFLKPLSSKLTLPRSPLSLTCSLWSYFEQNKISKIQIGALSVSLYDQRYLISYKPTCLMAASILSPCSQGVIGYLLQSMPRLPLLYTSPRRKLFRNVLLFLLMILESASRTTRLPSYT